MSQNVLQSVVIDSATFMLKINLLVNHVHVFPHDSSNWITLQNLVVILYLY